jgi:hypothetical protein
LYEPIHRFWMRNGVWPAPQFNVIAFMGQSDLSIR